MSAEELLAAALELSEKDRVMLAGLLLESVPESAEILHEDDLGFYEELERRSSDGKEERHRRDPWSSIESC